MDKKFDKLNKLFEVKQKKLEIMITKKMKTIKKKNKLEKKLIKINKNINKIKSRKILFSGKLHFYKNIYLSFTMGYSEEFQIKNRIINVVDGFIELEGTGRTAGGFTKIKRKFYWEDIYDYSDGIISIEKLDG